MPRAEKEQFKIKPIKDIYDFLNNISGCYAMKKGQTELIEMNLKTVDLQLLNLLWRTISKEFTDDFITWAKIKKLAIENGIPLQIQKQYQFLEVCPECGNVHGYENLKCPACNHYQNDYAKTCHECGYVYQDKIKIKIKDEFGNEKEIEKWDIKKVCPNCVKGENGKIVYRRTNYMIRKEV